MQAVSLVNGIIILLTVVLLRQTVEILILSVGVVVVAILVLLVAVAILWPNGSIIISCSLSRRGSRRQKVDLVRDPVVTLNSDGDQELPADVTGVSADTKEALMCQ